MRSINTLCLFRAFCSSYNAVSCSNTVAIWFPPSNLQPWNCFGQCFLFNMYLECHIFSIDIIYRLIISCKSDGVFMVYSLCSSLQYGLAEDTLRTGGATNPKDVSPTELYSQSAIYIAAAHALKPNYSVRVGYIWFLISFLFRDHRLPFSFDILLWFNGIDYQLYSSFVNITHIMHVFMILHYPIARGR